MYYIYTKIIFLLKYIYECNIKKLWDNNRQKIEVLTLKQERKEKFIM